LLTSAGSHYQIFIDQTANPRSPPTHWKCLRAISAHLT